MLPPDSAGIMMAFAPFVNKKAAMTDHTSSPARSDATTRTAPTSPLQRTWVIAVLAGIACFLWGSAFPSIKIGYALFGIQSSQVASEILFAGCRFVLAGVIALVFGSIVNRRAVLPRASSWKMVVMLALFQTVLQYVFYYIGVSHASGVKSGIINSLNTFFAIMLSSLVFKQEKLTARKLVGCALGIAGVVAINLTGKGLGPGLHWNGEGFVAIAAFSYAMSSALIHRYSQLEDPVALSGSQFITGGLAMVVGGLACGGTLPHVTGEGLAMLVYLGFISGIAYSLWSMLLKYNPVSRVAVFGFMNPIFGVALAAVLLGEAGQVPLWQCVLALVLVCAGIIVVNRVPAAAASEPVEALKSRKPNSTSH